MSQSQNVKIPAPLHTQLKALAAKRNTTMVAIIHNVVRDAIKAGEIPDETPGFEIKIDRGNHKIKIISNDEIFARINIEEAKELSYNAKTVVETHAQGPNGMEIIQTGNGTSISVGYRGTGIVFIRETLDNDVSRFVTTPMIALDIALKLETSADALSEL